MKNPVEKPMIKVWENWLRNTSYLKNDMKIPVNKKWLKSILWILYFNKSAWNRHSSQLHVIHISFYVNHPNRPLRKHWFSSGGIKDPDICRWQVVHFDPLCLFCFIAIMIVGIKIRNHWLNFWPLSLHVIEKRSKNGFGVTLKLITIWLITIIWLILVIEFLKGQTSVGMTR